MPIYQELFPKGSEVRTAPLAELEKFSANWKFHHKLQLVQLEHADKVCRVDKVSFYHGGDVLYELADVPGIWHEQCLTKAN